MVNREIWNEDLLSYSLILICQCFSLSDTFINNISLGKSNWRSFCDSTIIETSRIFKSTTLYNQVSFANIK